MRKPGRKFHCQENQKRKQRCRLCPVLEDRLSHKLKLCFGYLLTVEMTVEISVYEPMCSVSEDAAGVGEE